MTKYLYLILMCLLTLSCSVRKRTKTEQISQSTSTELFHIDKIKSNQAFGSNYRLRDTILKVGARRLRDTLSTAATKPVYDQQGKALPNKTHLRGSGVTVDLTVLPSGQIVIEATCDSLELLVKGLIIERDYYANKYDSASSVVLKTEKNESSNTEKTVSNSSFPWWGWTILTLVVVIIIVLVVIKVYKKISGL